MKSTRKFDTQYEKEIANFMDEYFYAKLPLYAKRIEDKELQLLGVDVQLYKNQFCRKCVSIDEKAKVYGTLNMVLKFPSFECAFVNSAFKWQRGWFLNKASLTDFYCFINIFGKNLKEMSDIKNENIEKAVVLMVSKNDILDLLDNRCVELEKEVKQLAAKRPTYPNEKLRVPLSDEFWLTKSCQLRERPINLVFRRTVLEQLPNSKQFEITRENVREIKL